MIKINLLPQKRAKLRGASHSSEGGQKEMAIGIGAMVAAAALVFFVLDQPKRSRLHELKAANEQLQQEINAKNQQLVGFAQLNEVATKAYEQSLDRGEGRAGERAPGTRRDPHHQSPADDDPGHGATYG